MLRRRTTIGIALAVLFAVGGYLVERRFSTTAPMIDVGVFFPGTDDEYWNNFVDGVRRAAGDVHWKFDDSADRYECVVRSPKAVVRFRWHPEVGSRGLQRRAAQLCREARPPLAVVGANNSSLTAALAGELARRPNAPVLLMTTATQDELLSILPGKSFRFGVSNSSQAQIVVERLAGLYAKKGIAKPSVQAILVDVLDDPFAVDLARRFESSLTSVLHAHFAPAPVEFRRGGRSHAWSLPTSTGSFDSPSEVERRFADQIARVLSTDPDKDWVLVLPLDTSQYRRLSYALTAALKSRGESGERARRRLTVLAGDSLGYEDFRNAKRQQILPEETPATVIFFAHANPLESAVGNDESTNPSAATLDRELARTLLTVLSDAAADATPDDLARRLAAYVPAGGDQTYFVHGQRRHGGGAIVAVPRVDRQDFELLPPAAWETKSKRAAKSAHP